MSLEIDPHEVLEHLEYLGYASVTKEQLKDFIRDLKKLIKYEQYKEKLQEHDMGGLEKVSVACETSFPFDALNGFSRQNEVQSPFKKSHDSATQHQTSPYDIASHCFQKSYHSEDYDLLLKSQDACVNCPKRCEKKMSCKTCLQKDCVETEKLHPPSFIRPGIGKSSKCDPVALYHYYQNQWSKRPLPGEDPRTDLRWAVRSRLAKQKQFQQQVILRKATSVDGVHRKKV